MFKKGGSANEGIMDGLVDRRGYAHGSPYKHYEKFQKVTINKIGEIESLNASVASGILLNELINNI